MLEHVICMSYETLKGVMAGLIGRSIHMNGLWNGHPYHVIQSTLWLLWLEVGFCAH